LLCFEASIALITSLGLVVAYATTLPVLVTVTLYVLEFGFFLIVYGIYFCPNGYLGGGLSNGDIGINLSDFNGLGVSTVNGF